MPGPYDPTLKAMVEVCPEDWLVFAGQPRAPAEALDTDVSTVAAAADKVIYSRATPPYLLHLEFQAGHDSAQLPGRLHLYNALLNARHALPVRSVAVLLRPEANSPALTGTLEWRFPGEVPYLVFRYEVIRVWEIPVESLLAAGPGTLPLAPISAVAQDDLPDVIARMRRRLGRELPRQRAGDLWAATFVLLGLRYSGALADQLLRGVLTMKESVTYQAIVAEGRAEGRAEGVLQGARNFLLHLGRKRFGAPNADVLAALEAITDVGYLEQLGERLDEVDSWHALLDVPTPRRRPRRRPPRS
ncbi:MAG TPA: hypothetical protein VJ739_03025 [Gemmataceae bacterium]|nr:hypothetical protein [Gemmataceae bacterium]